MLVPTGAKIQGWVRKFAPGLQSHIEPSSAVTYRRFQTSSAKPTLSSESMASTLLDHHQGDRGIVDLLHPATPGIASTTLPATSTAESPRASAGLLTSLGRTQLMKANYQGLRGSVPYPGYAARRGLLQMRETAVRNYPVHPPGALASTPLSSSRAERTPVISVRDLQPASANVASTPPVLIPRSHV